MHSPSWAEVAEAFNPWSREAETGRSQPGLQSSRAVRAVSKETLVLKQNKIAFSECLGLCSGISLRKLPGVHMVLVYTLWFLLLWPRIRPTFSFDSFKRKWKTSEFLVGARKGQRERSLALGLPCAVWAALADSELTRHLVHLVILATRDTT